MDFDPEKRIFTLDEDDVLVLGVIRRSTFHVTEAGILLQFVSKAQQERQTIRDSYELIHPWMNDIFGSMEQDDTEYFQHLYELLAAHGEFAEVDYVGDPNQP